MTGLSTNVSLKRNFYVVFVEFSAEFREKNPTKCFISNSLFLVKF